MSLAHSVEGSGTVSGSVRPCAKWNVLEIRLSTILWVLGFNLLFFQSAIQNATGFSYIDEGITLLLLLSAAIAKICMSSKFSNLGRYGVAAIICLALMCFVGLIGNAVWRIQGNESSILADLFTCIKFVIAFLSAYIVFEKSTQLFCLLQVEARLLIAAMLVFAVANLFFDFGMGSDTRFGNKSFMFILGHPTMVVAVCVGLIVILSRNKKCNIPWIAMCLVVIVLTFRAKGIAFVGITGLLVMTMGERQKLTGFHVFAGIVLALYLGYDQFSYYFSLEGGARNVLASTSVLIADTYFPFGSGFATYGSAVTSELSAYSPLYYEYGLSNVWGLAPGAASFLSDTFWPTIIGQFGWIGLLLFIVSMVSLFKLGYQSRKARLSVVLCFSYLLISSTSESAFFHPMAVYLAFCLGVALSLSSGDLAADSGEPSASRSYFHNDSWKKLSFDSRFGSHRKSKLDTYKAFRGGQTHHAGSKFSAERDKASE